MGEKDLPRLLTTDYSRRDIGKMASGLSAIYLLGHLRNGLQIGDDKVFQHPLEEYLHDPLAQQSEINKAILTRNPEKVYNYIGPEFFGNNPELTVAHKAGNKKETIDSELRKGVQVFDMDANCVNGVVYIEHGVVLSKEFKLWLLKLGVAVVIDVERGYTKLGFPDDTFDGQIRYVSELSTPEIPLGASVEFKRGNFSEPIVHRMFDTVDEYELPTIFKLRNPHEFNIVKKIRDERGSNQVLVGTSKYYQTF